MGYLYLAIAIVAEVIATGALKSSAGFSKFGPSLLVILGYGIAFYFLSIVLKTVPIGIAYAIWSGLGIVLVSLLGILFFKQSLDTAAIIGLSLIVIGVIVIQAFSDSAGH